jgi:hypothetical protein
VDQHSPAIARRVRDDEIGGLRSGVIGTPTFFVNDRHFHDRPDLETLSAAIGISLLSSCSKTPNASTTSRQETASNRPNAASPNNGEARVLAGQSRRGSALKAPLNLKLALEEIWALHGVRDISSALRGELRSGASQPPRSPAAD